MVASERDRPDIARRREQWAKYQGRIEPERLVFIDETWTKTNMAPLRGWSLCGTRLTAKVPHGRWRTTTFVAALRHDRITAPWVLDGPIDGESFTIYVEKVLLPTLQPGDIVLLVTDGFLEWENSTGEDFGTERLGAVVRQFSDREPEVIIAELYDAVLNFAQGTPQKDDLTAVLIKRSLNW